MFYQCGRCRSIYASKVEAIKCCQPPIAMLNVEEVQACINHDPLASVCYHCKGTGLVKRNINLVNIK